MITSLTSLSDVAAGVAGAVSVADVDTPATFLLVFYIAGILLILLTLSMRVLGNRLRRASPAALLVEAFPTAEMLETTLAGAAEAKPETAGNDVAEPTPKES